MKTDNRPVLATIFTGHTLDLASIEAVSHIQVATSENGLGMVIRKLFIVIYLKSGNFLNHTFFENKYLGRALSESERVEYNEAVDKFKVLRSDLLEQWAIAVSGHLAKEGGAES